MQNIDRFKFRYFIKESNNMADVLNGLSNYELKQHQEGKIVLMQCTGFRDKEGTLIYEGDILQINNCNNYIIKFNEERCNYYLKATETTFKHTTAMDGMDLTKSDAICFEAIRNIYDKELLEK